MLRHRACTYIYFDTDLITWILFWPKFCALKSANFSSSGTKSNMISLWASKNPRLHSLRHILSHSISTVAYKLWNLTLTDSFLVLLCLQHRPEPGAGESSLHEAGSDRLGPPAPGGQHVWAGPRKTRPDQGIPDPQQLQTSGQVKNLFFSVSIYCHSCTILHKWSQSCWYFWQLLW